VAECSCQYCLFIQFVPDVLCCLNHPLRIAPLAFKIQFNGIQIQFQNGNWLLECRLSCYHQKCMSDCYKDQPIRKR
jgi:hypothetical protein